MISRRFHECPGYVFFLSVVLPIILILGCARDKPHHALVREQSATIDSLTKEIQRLNDELDQAISAREDLKSAKKELEAKLSPQLAAGDLSLNMDRRGLVVTLLDRILFDSGKADLKESAKGTLDSLAGVLREKLSDHVLFVEGHTDNVPIRLSGWRSNWELSTARATEVIHYFISGNGMNPERLAAVGYSEHQPVATNETGEGRAQNRRVEVIVSPLHAFSAL